MTFLGRTTILLVLASAAAPAYSQSSATDVPDRFFLEVGGFNIGADTKLRLSAARLGGTTVDFETDLTLPDRATIVFLDAYWRVARRHLLHVDFARLSRESEGTLLSREITWGGQVYPVGLRVQGRVDSDYVSGIYRFAAYRNDTFEVGPALGFGYVWITAALDVSGSAGAPTGTLVDREGKTGSPTGNLGA